MSRLRVLVADSQLAFAQAVAGRIADEPDITVVGVAATAAATAQLLGTVPVDVLVVAVGLEDGIGVAVAAVQRDTQLRFVVVADDEAPALAVEALAAGAAGFISKAAAVEDLLAAIRGSVRGETSLSSELLTGVLDELLLHRPRHGATNVLSRLTAREQEILECLVSGMNRATIARHLFLSTHTVRTHMRNLLSKLGAHSTLEAVALAREAGVAPSDVS